MMTHFSTESAFKVIIAGSRDRYGVEEEYLNEEYKKIFMQDYHRVMGLLENKKNVQFVTGCCPTGADQLAYYLANNSEANHDPKEFPPDWDTHGLAAGPIRNLEMAKYADALILLWDEKSRGSKNMLMCARKEGIKVRQIIGHLKEL